MKLLRTVWDAWKRVGQAIGDLIARIVLTLFYFTVFVPFGLAVRLLTDPLDIKAVYPAAWLERTAGEPALDDARRLF